MSAVRRRDFIAGLGASAWSLSARAQQQPALPVVAFINSGRRSDVSDDRALAFSKGLRETGYVENQNVRFEYHWLENQKDRMPAAIDDLVRRRVAVIITDSDTAVIRAVQAATSSIPILFETGADPVRSGLVASLARPGGNATGINFLNAEAVTKRLGLLHLLVPKAVRIAVLVNPVSGATGIIKRDVPEAARRMVSKSRWLKQQPPARSMRSSLPCRGIDPTLSLSPAIHSSMPAAFN
jgi:putative tryptophan/tyrosine transport system substrate-binding protein